MVEHFQDFYIVGRECSNRFGRGRVVTYVPFVDLTSSILLSSPVSGTPETVVGIHVRTYCFVGRGSQIKSRSKRGRRPSKNSQGRNVLDVSIDERVRGQTKWDWEMSQVSSLDPLLLFIFKGSGTWSTPGRTFLCPRFIWGPCINRGKTSTPLTPSPSTINEFKFPTVLRFRYNCSSKQPEVWVEERRFGRTWQDLCRGSGRKS